MALVSPAELALMLERSAVKIREELVLPTKAVMEAVAKEAKEAIGTYDYGWQQLAPATQEERVRMGYSANEPLKRTGELQASVVGDAEQTTYGAEGAVGSDDPIAIFHEFGTVRMPARAVFSTAMLVGVEEMASKVYGEFAEEVLSLKL